MKRCPKCGEIKPIEEFNFKVKAKNLRQVYCRMCSNAYVREHYKKNTDYYKQKTIRRKEKLRNWFRKYKETLCCEKCGINHPAVLVFHHLDPSKKDFAVSQLVGVTTSMSQLKSEIEKCQVLCANCHRILHWEQKHAS